MSLFAIDSCYLQLARDKHLQKGQVNFLSIQPHTSYTWRPHRGRPTLRWLGKSFNIP